MRNCAGCHLFSVVLLCRVMRDRAFLRQRRRENARARIAWSGIAGGAAAAALSRGKAKEKGGVEQVSPSRRPHGVLTSQTSALIALSIGVCDRRSWRAVGRRIMFMTCLDGGGCADIACTATLLSNRAAKRASDNRVDKTRRDGVAVRKKTPSGVMARLHRSYCCVPQTSSHQTAVFVAWRSSGWT